VEANQATDVTSQQNKPNSKEVSLWGRFRGRSERGAAAVEMAITGILLITLAIGGGEYGLLMSSKHDLSVSTRLAGRIASSPCASSGGTTAKGILKQVHATPPVAADYVGKCDKAFGGNTEFDDFYILRAIESGIGGKMSNVQKVIIYKSVDADVLNSGRPPAICASSTTGVQGVCNVYTKDQTLVGNSSKTLFANLDYFYADGALWGEHLVDNFSCGVGRPTTPLCPIPVGVGGIPYRIRNVRYPTSLGIYVQLKHDFVTGFFRQDQKISEWSMFRLEPSPDVSQRQQDPCAATPQPPGCHGFPSVSISGGSATESPVAGNCAMATVTLTDSSPALTSTETVVITASNGSAATPGDYLPSSIGGAPVVNGAFPMTISFVPGQSKTKSICIPIVNDNIWEQPEAFSLHLGGASTGLQNGAGTVDGVHDATINVFDDDPPPRLTINSIPLNEGETGNFLVGLDNPSGSDVTFTYTTIDGTAQATQSPIGDYTQKTGSFTIPAGSTGPVSIPVTALVDDLTEPGLPETFYVQLSNPTGGALLPAANGTASINDLTPPVVVWILPPLASATEGNPLTFRLKMNHLSDADTAVNYSTQDLAGQATGGSACGTADYVSATNKTLATAIPANTLNGSITIATCTDLVLESSETMQVNLNSTPAPGSVDAAQKSATGIITDNTPVPPIVIGPTSVSVVEGNQLDYSLSLQYASNVPVTITYKTIDGVANGTYDAAIAGASGDYTAVNSSCTIPAGSTTDPSCNFFVQSLDDAIDELKTERFTVSATGSTPGSSGNTATAKGYITDNDPTPTTTTIATTTTSMTTTKPTTTTSTTTKVTTSTSTTSTTKPPSTSSTTTKPTTSSSTTTTTKPATTSSTTTKPTTTSSTTTTTKPTTTSTTTKPTTTTTTTTTTKPPTTTTHATTTVPIIFGQT
jgi:Calx-beta domain